MRVDIHPAYSDVKVTCSCGAVYETRSTRRGLYRRCMSRMSPTPGNRRFSTPEVVLTALISALVDALFRTKISVKGTFLVTLAFSSVVFAELCPTPKGCPLNWNQSGH